MSQHRTGPVRSEQARTAILAATARLLVERGYENLTIEGIALEAHVGKQTIYRWWGSKSTLVAECLLDGRIFADRLTIRDTGNVHADLASWLNVIFDIVAEPSGEILLRSIIAAAAENIEIGRRLRESLGAGSVVEDRLRRAIDTAELRADAPLTEITESLIGAVIIRALSRMPSEPGAAERLVDAVLRGNTHPH